MKNFYPIIEEYVEYALAMRCVFQKILERLLPGRKSHGDFFGCKEQFLTILDDEFEKIDFAAATVEDYRLALEAVCCNDVEQVIDFLVSVSRNVGFEKYAYRYLDKKRFVSMMCDCDEEKLAQLDEIVSSGDKDPGRVLMRVSGVLDGRRDAYESLGEAAKAKASADAQKVAKRALVMDFLDLSNTRNAIEHKPEEEQNAAAEAVAECMDSVKSTVESIEKKVDSLTQTVERQKERRGSKRGTKRQRSAEVRRRCVFCWKVAQKNAEVRNSVNTRVTYAAAFAYCRSELLSCGVTDPGAFRRVIHSAQSLECEARKRALYAMQRIGKGEKAKVKGPLRNC